MIIVHVHIQVKPEAVQEFIQATSVNALESRKEPGIAVFDLLQQDDDPTKFLLIEIYKSSSAPLDHKNSAHYQTWRDTVAPMMEVPRSSTKYKSLVP